jgi:hypothetical protein
MGIYNKDELSVERMKRLESIVLVWGVHEVQCMKMYNRLVVYKKRHKSTQVPYAYTEDDSIHLGTWVIKQRNVYNAGKLLKKRVELLNSIDFARVGER